MRIDKRLPTPGGDDGIWPTVLNEWGEQVREVVNDQDDRLSALEPLFPATQEAAAATQLAKLAAEAAAATAIERVTVALAPTDTQVADLVDTPASATSAALSSTIATRLDSSDTVVLMGTSITAQNGNLQAVPGATGRLGTTGYETAATTHLFDNIGYWHHAAVMSGHRLTVVANKGIGGNTTTQMLARFDADVLGLSPRPAWLLLEPGPNDQGGAIPAGTSIANITEMITRARNAGMRVILCTITPSNTLTATGDADRARVNAWIKQSAASLFPGTLIVDWTKSTVDAAGGPLLAAFKNESGFYVHPNSYGAALMGRELANVLRDGVPAIDRLPSDPSDPLNIADNAFNNGSSGGVVTGLTVQRIAGGAITGTASVVPRTDGIPGQWQRVALTAGDARVRWDSTDLTKWSPGDYVYGHIEFQTLDDWVTPRSFYALVEQIDAGGVAIKNSWAVIYRSTDPDLAVNPRSGTFYIPPFLVVPTVTRLRMQVVFRLAGGVGAGTFDVGRRGFYKIGA